MSRRRLLAVVAALASVLGLSTGVALAKPPSTAPSVTEFSQCANGGPPSTSLACTAWINGILNASNSHYSEDQVTPQRLLLAVPSGGANHTITIRYLTRKGSAPAHAYDSLATWNVTQTAATPCQSLSAALCAGTPSTFQMQSDPTAVPPAGAGISTATSAHELPAASRFWTLYGGVITASSPVTHSSAANPSTDDFASVTITFHATAANVLLLFGGHLAVGGSAGVLRAWGAGLGSSNINGGPYHIIVDAIDGAAVGNRDNQIQSSAILPGSPSFTITKTASPLVTSPGGTVTYTITVTNNGTASGSAMFIDNFDDRLSPTSPISNPTGGTCTREPSGTDRYFSCTTSLLAAGGGSQTFTYTATMPTSFSGSSGTGGCATGQYPVVNTVTLATGGTQTVTVCVTAAPSFTVTKSASPNPADPGQTVTYTITVTNNGTASGSTTFIDNYDDRLTPTVPAGCTATTINGGDKVLSCTTGTIAAGGNQVFTYTAVMPTTGTTGTNGCGETQFAVRNTVTLANGGTQTVTVCVNQPAFTISKSADLSVANPGQTVTYTITVTNVGTASGSTTFIDNYDDRLTPTVPAGCTATTINNGDKVLSCTTGTIAAGGHQIFTYTAAMPTTFSGSSGTGGCATGQFPVINTVTLANGGTDTETVCVNAAPRFTVAKSASPNPANPGQTVTYTITVTNGGTASGSTTFIDNYDDRLTPTVPAGCTATTINNGDKVLSCTTGTIAAGGNQVFTYTAVMPTTFTGSDGTNGCAPTQFAVQNTVTLANGDTQTVTVCVNTPAFTVTKSANPTVASPGQTVTYTITVTNVGTAAGSTTFIDNYDDRLNPTVPAGCTATTINNGDKVLSCTTNTIAAGQDQIFTYTAAMPSTFSGSSGTGGCSTGQFPVINTVTLANGDSDSARVCVNAAPAFTVTKSASPSTATPGQTVTYTITVTNTGTASGSTTFIDNYDDRLSPTVPAGCTATTINGGDKVLSCTTGTIAAGGNQVFTYTAAMPTTFTGTPGTNGCSADNPHQYPVRNVVVLANGSSDDSTVCVTASPDLHIVKSAVIATDDAGNQYITYTITYTNTGPAEAPQAGITDPIPAGTTYDSCTGGCVPVGNPTVTSVTWVVGPVAPLTGTGSVTFTVLVTATQQCTVTNTAQIQFRSDPPVSSNTVVVNVTPKSNPAGAHANGSAIGAQVLSSGLLHINTSPISTASTSQSGLGGPKLDNQSVLSVAIPTGGAVLSASVLTTTSASIVTAAPDSARQTSTAEVAHVCVVPVAGVCTVETDTVRAVASTNASGTDASYSSAGSTIQNLKVVGLGTPVDLNQTTTIALNPLVFGAGSYVAINERQGSAGLTGGTYHADLTVTMIHVKITGLLGLQAAEVIVARATAHSDFPQTFVCTGAANRSVSGYAYVASLATNPVIANVLQGYVQISPLGGSETQHIVALAVPANGSVVAAAAADSSSTGSVSSTQSTATSQAEIAGNDTTPACVLKTGSTCVVTAQVIHSEAHSTATSAGSTSTDAGTSLVNVSVLGIPIAGTPAPNTVIPLLGLGYLVLNEQFCDGGGLATHTCSGATHSGITVRALDLVVNLSNSLGLPVGAQVIVAEAHADSTFS
jgi:uncharacterized repeat protein (TIGR01451 family)